ncbi:MAG: hypothetical protein QOH42_857 [Blastocatellia bacterium]|nr:hypothetical protein [Blastocatellia bacterium]
MTIPQNGNQPVSSGSKARSALSFKASWCKALGKIFEVLAVLVFTCMLSVVWIASGQKTMAIVIIAITAGLLWAAAEFSFRAVRASEALAMAIELEAGRRNHVISSARMRTLVEAKVPNDVIEYLQTLIAPKATPIPNVESNNGHKCDSCTDRVTKTTSELLFALRKGLGPERTDEVKDLVLKYTEESAEMAHAE